MAGKRMYMPLWPDAWLLDTGHLTYEQKGIYNDLLQHMWLRDGYLQNDDAFLARLLGLTLGKWRRVSPAIMALLTVEQNRVTQKRLIAEYNRSVEKIEKLTKSGREGGLAKSLKNKVSGLADATANATADATANAEATPKGMPEQTAGKRSAHYSLLSTQKPSVSEDRAGEDPDAIFRQAAAGQAASTADRPDVPEAPKPKPAVVKDYAIDQGKVRLTYDDLEKWQGLYPSINVAGEVTGMAGWLNDKAREGKNWFQVAQGALAKRDRERRKEIEDHRIKVEAAAKHGAIQAAAPRNMAI